MAQEGLQTPMEAAVPVAALQVTTISHRSLEVSVPIVHHGSFWRLTTLIIGILGGLVGFSILLFLVWLSIRGPPREELPRTAPRPLSYNVPSTQSHYPRSLSVYSPGPEMDERGGQILVIQVSFSHLLRRDCCSRFSFCIGSFE